MGVVCFTVRLAVGKPVVWLSGTGINPESKPLARRVHGFAKVDCVTEWAFCLKVNSITSPTLALTESGTNFRPAAPPTITLKVSARPRWADASSKN